MRDELITEVLCWELEAKMSNKPEMKVTVMPAGHGDCILVQCGEFNIMVDSGPHDAKIHERVHAALARALGGQPIHLAVVTHQDNDHIGGLERMLKDGALPVHALLFNSPRRIREYIDRHTDEEVDASARQALYVARQLEPCNAEAVVAGERHMFFDDRIELVVLSPCGKDILHYGERMLAAISKEELAGSRGRAIPVCGQVDELLTMDDADKDTDRSEVNALSFAFILKFEERSILFLGDSWPSRVTHTLAALLPGGTRWPLDLVFVAHHGSRNNNTEELHRHIDATRYVISADGRQNPDVETFGRILRAAAPGQPEFYFSENSPQLKAMFSKSDIRVHFPESSPLTFNL
ncbi:MBL fold metallo-hydrolase [Paraburkholderia sp. 22B1P]|uniref:ComEC/Rec2 family competence protein n=1 Tax=Paraburkholderia sp. 22B1P TaxID=3080498 RepID=UPI0030CCB864